MTHFRSPVYADERNGSPLLVNCVTASGVNLARAATNGLIPATDAEVTALRKATGDVTGGQTIGQLITGMERRYGFSGDRTHDWPSIEDGLVHHGTWFVVLGWYRMLPERLKNPGQGDVFHAVCIGPDTATTAVILDPIQRGRVTANMLTLAEVKRFAASGGYDALGKGEYSETPHVSVYCRTILASTFIYSRAPWKRRRAFGVQFTARCTKAEPFFVMGKTRRMVEVKTGPHTGDWLDIAASHITYVEKS